MEARKNLLSKSLRGLIPVVVILLLALPGTLRAQQDDFDSAKLRIDAFWFYSFPSGTLQGAVDQGTIDLQKDLGFTSYSTFAGKVDWRFTRKNHFYLAAAPYDSTHTTTLTRTFTFQGQTFEAGLVAQSKLNAVLLAPGYQYDIFRRRRWHLGIALQMDLFDTHASINAAAQVVGETEHAAVSASGSLLAPIPVAGPQFRVYLTDSPRVFVEGNVFGMYFGGYGNFVSTADTLGVTLNKHLSLNVGYSLGSRLVVSNNASSNRIGLRMTQQGVLSGLEFYF